MNENKYSITNISDLSKIIGTETDIPVCADWFNDKTMNESKSNPTIDTTPIADPNNIALAIVTYSHEDNNDDVHNSPLLKSFKKFNPNKEVIHHHFNRSQYRDLESEHWRKFASGLEHQIHAQTEFITYRIVLWKDILEKMTCDYIVSCDTSDVVCLSPIDDLVNKFDLDNFIVFGHEKNHWPPQDVKSKWPNYSDYSDDDLKNQTFLNAGMILAKRTKYIELLESVIENVLSKDFNTLTGDQGAYTYYYNKSFNPAISLDIDCSFGLNTFTRSHDEYEFRDGKLTSIEHGTSPVFIHDNGWNHGSPKYINHFKLKSLYLDHYPRFREIADNPGIAPDHIEYLKKIKNDFNFSPSVIYDIGACVGEWTTIAKPTWPNSEYILFEATKESEDILSELDHKYHIAVLSDTDGKEVTFCRSLHWPGGNSYYRENPVENAQAEQLFNTPENKFKRTTRTLDSIVAERGFPAPDLLKIDVQGCEIDILRGASQVLSSVKHLIIELQHREYNIGAQLNTESIPIIEGMGFKLVQSCFSHSSHADADYHFVKEA